jgi:rubrerythrin
LCGRVANTPENLRNAIEAETSETEMFARFAQQATEDGDLSAARAFENIRKDKISCCAKFEAILAEIGVHSEFQTITQ